MAIAADKRDFRLTKSIRPNVYELHFELDLEHWTFTGRARIGIHADQATREITLHADELNITGAWITNGPRARRIEYEEESETATLSFADDVTAGDHCM